MTPSRSLACAVLGLLLLATACAQSSADPPSDSAAASSPPVSDEVALTGTEWLLQEFVVAGQTTDVRAADAVLRFDGNGSFSASACNSQVGRAEIQQGRLRLLEMNTTEKGCSGDPGGPADEGLFAMQDRWLSWVIDGDRLELTVADGTLRYAVRDTADPISTGRELAGGEANENEYRVSLAEGGDELGLVLEASTTDGTWLRCHVDVGPDQQPLHAVAAAGLSVGLHDFPDPARTAFVASFVPIDTARVTHQRRPDLDPAELDLIDIGDPRFLVTAGFTSRHTPQSSLVAYGVDGSVIAAWP